MHRGSLLVPRRARSSLLLLSLSSRYLVYHSLVLPVSISYNTASAARLITYSEPQSTSRTFSSLEPPAHLLSLPRFESSKSESVVLWCVAAHRAHRALSLSYSFRAGELPPCARQRATSSERWRRVVLANELGTAGQSRVVCYSRRRTTHSSCVSFRLCERDLPAGKLQDHRSARSRSGSGEFRWLADLGRSALLGKQ